MERRDYRLAHAGLGFHVTEWGSPQGLPIVMLHGIRGYAETFSGIAASLQPDYRVIAFDQRGRGQTDWDPACNYYTDTYVEDLAAVADKLSLARFVLLGHSMGGINAIVYAACNPRRVSRLIIEDAGPGAFEDSDGARRIRRELAETPAGFPSWEAASAFMRALRPSVSEEARQQRLNSMLKPAPEGGFTWRYDHVASPERAAARPGPHGGPGRYVAASPAHSVGARRPLRLPAAGHGQTHTRSQSSHPAIEIADAGHYVHDDQPSVRRRGMPILETGVGTTRRREDRAARTSRPIRRRVGRDSGATGSAGANLQRALRQISGAKSLN